MLRCCVAPAAYTETFAVDEVLLVISIWRVILVPGASRPTMYECARSSALATDGMSIKRIPILPGTAAGWPWAATAALAGTMIPASTERAIRRPCTN